MYNRILTLSLMVSFSATSIQAADCVILLHGLARTKNSMHKIEMRLREQGYDVVNQGYDSRTQEISKLSEEAISAAISLCKEGERINFVTHSMGGILVRDYFYRHSIAPLPSRVVMLAPPNHGSAIIDEPLYADIGSFINGPAGGELSAEPDSFVNSLPAVDYPVGVIAGNHSLNPIYSEILPGPDDGKVSVQSTELAGATDWIEMPVNHTFIMENDDVIQQVEHFLQNGVFDK